MIGISRQPFIHEFFIWKHIVTEIFFFLLPHDKVRVQSEEKEVEQILSYIIDLFEKSNYSLGIPFRPSPALEPYGCPPGPPDWYSSAPGEGREGGAGARLGANWK